jgi:hypothetical protein
MQGGQGSARGQSSTMDLEEMESRAAEGLREARGAIEGFARENPRTAVAIALGVGFVLGGGLTPRILFGIGALAARRFASDYARNQLGAMTRGALGIQEPSSGNGHRGGSTPRERPSQS